MRGGDGVEAVGLFLLGVWEGGVEGSCGVVTPNGRGVLAQGDQCEACIELAVGLVVLGVWEGGVESEGGVEALSGRGVLWLVYTSPGPREHE